MLNAQFINTLRNIVGNANVLTDPADCWPYGYDNSRQHVPPEAVAFATTHDEVLAIVQLCNEHKVPLTARARCTAPLRMLAHYTSS